MRKILTRTPLLITIAILIPGGCSENKSGAKTPKEAADLFVESLKANDFKKFSVLVPMKSDVHGLIDERDMPKEAKQKARERVDEAYSKKDPMVEMKRLFDNIRERYPDDFWKDVKVEGYEGIEVSKEGNMEVAEVFVKLKSNAGNVERELKLGEIVKAKGRWLLMTEPRWI